MTVYSEVPCKLCGVSFNIKRIRQNGEPYYAAWDSHEGFPGDKYHKENYVHKPLNYVCGIPNCQDRSRKFLPWRDESEENDDDYECVQSELEDEKVLEYYSDEETVNEAVCAQSQSSDDEAQELSLESTPVDPSTSDVTGALKARGPEIEFVEIEGETFKDPEGEPNSGSDIALFRREQRKLFRKFEHLAGPYCAYHGGYSGQRVSPAEIRGCTTFQCLVKKPDDWAPEELDQDFERQGQYFLSSLSSFMPSRDFNNPRFLPIRHGIQTLHVDTILWGYESENPETPVPFHPTCFEIFTRASRDRFGFLDIIGLTGWRKLESDYASKDDFPRHYPVRTFHDEEWDHVPGEEWLAANPIIVPGLRGLLSSALAVPKSMRKSTTTEDPFSKLPRELSDVITGLLHPVDIASLRLASCARYFPISDWRIVLKEEMPWLFEVWDTERSSIWATASYHELRIAAKRMEDAHAEFQYQQRLHETVIQEEMPEIWDAWKEDNSWLYEVPESDIRSYLDPESAALEEPFVFPEETNWCYLYYVLSLHWEKLKGLKNRQRIWMDVQEILRRIEVYRQEGRIIG